MTVRGIPKCQNRNDPFSRCIRKNDCWSLLEYKRHILHGSHCWYHINKISGYPSWNKKFCMKLNRICIHSGGKNPSHHAIEVCLTFLTLISARLSRATFATQSYLIYKLSTPTDDQIFVISNRIMLKKQLIKCFQIYLNFNT